MPVIFLGEGIIRIGPDALPIVALISFLIGLIIAFVGAVQLQRFGATIFVADLVGVAMVREMGAVQSTGRPPVQVLYPGATKITVMFGRAACGSVEALSWKSALRLSPGLISLRSTWARGG